MKSAEFGTVSHGTLRTEDLIDAFADELEWQIQRNGDHFSMPEHFAARDRLNALVHDAREWTPESNEDGDEFVNELADALDEFAPPYAYFGAHIGDGSDFGFWVSEDALQDFDGLRVSDLSEVPADYNGEVLHVNDHGNASLYVAQNDKFREVWALV